jgi:hypothetical protein
LIPENLNFGGGAASTVVNPVVLMLVLLAGILICVLPRSKAIVPFLAVGILIPMDQLLVVGGLHFPMLRVLALFGFIRMFWTKLSGKDEIFSGGMNGIDKALIILTIFTAVDGILLWRVSGEVIFQLGDMYTAFGVYFFLRFLVRDEEDIRRALRVLAFMTVAIAALMTYEHITGRNPYYAILGGVHSAEFSSAINRSDIFRARGCFLHPILAGTFGGFMMPLFAGWWWKEKRERKYALLGVLASMAIPFLTGSSTALFGLIGAIGALCLWPLRRHMRILRWGIVGTLVAGQLYMTSPVWHLISDVSLSDGSSSYHRYMLVDQCIRHFWDWAMVGTKDMSSWGWDMWDLSNQYVGIADTAGLIPFIAFLAILVYGFKYLGRARKAYEGDRKQEFLVWALGASLFANVVAFMGVQYFDQIIVAWYLILAIISVVTLASRKAETVPQTEFDIVKPSVSFHSRLAQGSATIDRRN